VTRIRAAPGVRRTTAPGLVCQSQTSAAGYGTVVWNSWVRGVVRPVAGLIPAEGTRGRAPLSRTPVYSHGESISTLRDIDPVAVPTCTQANL
jgi:hypothetical protein